MVLVPRSIRFPRLVCLSLLTGLMLLPGVQTFAQTAAPAPFTKFTRDALKQFDTWDSNHDGTLSETEIDALLTSPKVTGEDAAVAASLKIAVRSRKFTVPPITRDYLNKFDAYAATQPVKSGTAAKEAEVAIGDTVLAPKASAEAKSAPFPPLERIRRLCLTRIQHRETAAFTGTPKLNTVHQGQLGDCYFLAVLGAMLNRDAENVHQMIAACPDGSFDVTFPAVKKTHVPAFTDGEIALSSSASNSGRWVAVFEAAFGDVRNGILNTGKDSKDVKQIAVATDAIRDGGSILATIRTLTGHNARRFVLRRTGVQEMPPTDRAATRLPALRDTITSALKDKRLIGASTNTADLPPAISPKHAYAILSFDAVSDTVTLWNPHGNQFTPVGEPGLKNGYPTKDGVFTVPLAELARIFVGVTWETADPVPPATIAVKS